MKIVPIKKRSSITPIALASLMHKSCVICSDDDFVPIRSLSEAYDHAWDHWDAWQEERQRQENKKIDAHQLELFSSKEKKRPVCRWPVCVHRTGRHRQGGVELNATR